jgi:hypothetical protein
MISMEGGDISPPRVTQPALHTVLYTVLKKRRRLEKHPSFTLNFFFVYNEKVWFHELAPTCELSEICPEVTTSFPECHVNGMWEGVGRANGGFWLVSPFRPPLLEWHSDVLSCHLNYKFYIPVFSSFFKKNNFRFLTPEKLTPIQRFRLKVATSVV